MGEQVKAGPELDALVAEKVMGWKVYRGSEPNSDEAVFPHVLVFKGKVLLCRTGPMVSYEEWSPSKDAAADVEVLEHVRKTWPPNQQRRFLFNLAVSREARVEANGPWADSVNARDMHAEVGDYAHSALEVRHGE